MKMKFGGVFVASVFLILSVMSARAFATLDQQKIIKSVFPGKDKYSCTICHVAKLPKKDSHELNDYGKKALDAAGGAGKKPTAEIYQQLGDPDASK